MRKIKLLFAFIAILGSTKAQVGNNSGFTLSLGPSTGYSLHSSFNKFRKSYNEFYESTGILEKSMNVFTPNYGFQITGRAYFDGFTIFGGYNCMQANTSAQLTSGGTRRFKRTTRLPFYAGVGFGASNEGYFDLTFAFGRTEILSSYVYPDGTVSYGQDSPLNGSYSAFNGLFGIAYEKPFKGKFRHFHWRANLMLSLIPVNSEKQFTDWFYPRTKLYGYFTELPTDFETYIQNPNGYDVKPKYQVNNRMRILQFSLLYELGSK
jgi:hypothetical protein